MCPRRWVCDRERWRMTSVELHYRINRVKMERASQNRHSKSFFQVINIHLGENRPPKHSFHLKWVLFLIGRGVPYSLIYLQQRNTTRKTSFMRWLRCQTHFSAWFDHTVPCSEIWLQNSNFHARGTIACYDQKCFSAMYHRFYIAGLLRKKFSKKW